MGTVERAHDVRRADQVTPTRSLSCRRRPPVPTSGSPRTGAWPAWSRLTSSSRPSRTSGSPSASGGARIAFADELMTVLWSALTTTGGSDRRRHRPGLGAARLRTATVVGLEVADVTAAGPREGAVSSTPTRGSVSSRSRCASSTATTLVRGAPVPARHPGS
ncbi:hypothetical protein HBB16_06220 [Pseudonocardia sp. MCCB 268]|nr:hypothetical protein [Pseudonocardia cytotoxica]